MIRFIILILLLTLFLNGCDDLNKAYNNAVDEQSFEKSVQSRIVLPDGYKCQFEEHDYIMFYRYKISKDQGKTYECYWLHSDCFVHSPDCKKCLERKETDNVSRNSRQR